MWAKLFNFLIFTSIQIQIGKHQTQKYNWNVIKAMLHAVARASCQKVKSAKEHIQMHVLFFIAPLIYNNSVILQAICAPKNFHRVSVSIFVKCKMIYHRNIYCMRSTICIVSGAFDCVGWRFLCAQVKTHFYGFTVSNVLETNK